MISLRLYKAISNLVYGGMFRNYLAHIWCVANEVTLANNTDC